MMSTYPMYLTIYSSIAIKVNQVATFGESLQAAHNTFRWYLALQFLSP